MNVPEHKWGSPNLVNLSNMVRYHALRSPDREAILYDGRKITYGMLQRRVEKVAAWLAASRVEPDDIVAVLMKNSSAFLEISIAVSYVGAVFLPINFRLSADEVDFICKDAGARLLIVDEELQDRCGRVCDVIVLPARAQADSTLLCGRDEAVVPPVRRRPDDLFRLMYTSWHH